MAWSHDYLVRMTLDDGGPAKIVTEKSLVDQSTVKFVRSLISLSTTTSNYQVVFGSNFTTPTKLCLIETAGATFTYSVGATNLHHKVAASGCAFLHGSIASLYLSNNSTNGTPTIEVLLVR